MWLKQGNEVVLGFLLCLLAGVCYSLTWEHRCRYPVPVYRYYSNADGTGRHMYR